MSLFEVSTTKPSIRTLHAPTAYLKTLALKVLGECPPQKHIFYQEINYAEQNGYLKVLIGCVCENDGRGEGRGLVALQSRSTIKKDTRTLDF